MADTLYNIVFEGQTRWDIDLGQVKNNLAAIFKTNPERIESLFAGQKRVVKKEVDHATALRYIKAFDKAGAICHMVPVYKYDPNAKIPTPATQQQGEKVGTLRRSMTCPKCGHSQILADVCVKCGLNIEEFMNEKKATFYSSFYKTLTEKGVPGWAIKYGLPVLVILLLIPFFIPKNQLKLMNLYQHDIPQFPKVSTASTYVHPEWNFSSSHSTDYVFETTTQTLSSSNPVYQESADELSGSASDSTQETLSQLVQGCLRIESQGNQTARIVFDNCKAYSGNHLDPNKKRPAAQGYEIPMSIIYGLQEDGSLQAANNSEYFTMSLLFLLPTRPMTINETLRLPVDYTAQTNFTDNRMSGYVDMQLLEYVTIKDNVCIHFRNHFNLSSVFDANEYMYQKTKMRGVCDTFFDREKQRIVISRVSQTTSVEMESDFLLGDFSSSEDSKKTMTCICKGYQKLFE